MFNAPLLQDTAFVSSWKTNNAGSSSSTQITIPTSSSGTYGCQVDWGDGTSSVISTYNDAAWTHTYSGAGTYTVKIYGTFTGIVFANGGDRLKLLNISKWGTNFRLGTTQGSYFYGCANLTITATDILNTQGTTSMASAFRACTSLTTVPNMGLWKMSNVTTTANMFQDSTVFNENIGAWDVSSVTTMTAMFQVGSGSAFNQDISGWNTSSCTNMSLMFLACTSFNQNLNSWDVSKVTTLRQMFQGCTQFNQNLNSWNTGACTTMFGMFLAAVSFNGNITSWNTANVTAMDRMFNAATSFNQNISGWNTAKVTTFSQTFDGATSFNQNLGAWSIAALTNGTNMFNGVTLSKTNYNGLLAGWGAQGTIQNNVTFSGGNSHYDSSTGGYNGTAGRLVLTGSHSWTVSDGGTP